MAESVMVEKKRKSFIPLIARLQLKEKQKKSTMFSTTMFEQYKATPPTFCAVIENVDKHWQNCISYCKVITIQSGTTLLLFYLLLLVFLLVLLRGPAG